MTLNRREFLASSLSAALWARGGRLARAADPDRVLYNGIVLGDPWPPREPLSFTPRTPPYLVSPPRVIPIDVGRQLFVDDFLIESSSLQRVFHRAAPWSDDPVLAPDREWERRRMLAPDVVVEGPATAMVYSDGVFYDAEARLYKMWYMAGYLNSTAYAVSEDGLIWTKPALDVVEGTNIVLPGIHRDSTTVWIDRSVDDSEPYKSIVYHHAREYGGPTPLVAYRSADGIHWRQAETVLESAPGDRNTVFFNPFRNRWVHSLRRDEHGAWGRYRAYAETDRFGRFDRAVDWVLADDRDHSVPKLQPRAELYNLDCVAYESVLLGLFTIFRGDRPGGQKINEICLGFSRDGFHWSRIDRRPLIGVSPDARAWNHGNVQSAGGGCLIVGDRLHFYVSGRRGDPERPTEVTCSTGLFTLRRDGFASLAPATTKNPATGRPSRVGVLTTRRVRFSGAYLFVNADLGRGGELRVEVLDERGVVIAPLTRTGCEPVRGDSTKHRVRWAATDHLAGVAGRPVHFRFTMTGGRFYSFWVSASERGESAGYVAAGGPDFGGARDL